MSLLRLLTTGRSLVGLRNGESPYRLSQHRLVPNFGKKPNPFRASTLPEPARTVALALENPTVKSPTTPAASTPENAAPIPPESAGAGAAPAIEAAKELVPAKPVRSRWLQGYWTRLRSGFRRTEKPAAPRMDRTFKPAVQGELSLEGVQVVRNDLRDSDLEVVTAQEPRPVAKLAAATEPAAAGRMPEPILVARSVAGAGRTAFSRMSARLFGAVKL